jgi:hypothetical protein
MKPEKRRGPSVDQRVRELLEDLHDLAVVAERKAEKPIALEELKRRLKNDDLLV